MTPSMLPEIDRRTLESWLLEFDTTWADGRLKEFVGRLPAPGSPLRRVALVELIKPDLNHQRALGGRPQLAGSLHASPNPGTPAAPPPEFAQGEPEPRQPTVAPAK